MLVVGIVIAALWLLAGLAIFSDGHRARKNIDAILLSSTEPVRADEPTDELERSQTQQVTSYVGA